MSSILVCLGSSYVASVASTSSNVGKDTGCNGVEVYYFGVQVLGNSTISV